MKSLLHLLGDAAVRQKWARLGSPLVSQQVHHRVPGEKGDDFPSWHCDIILFTYIAGGNQAAVADLDGDGWLDVVTANLGSDDVSVLLNAADDAAFFYLDAPTQVAAGLPFDLTVRPERHRPLGPRLPLHGRLLEQRQGGHAA